MLRSEAAEFSYILRLLPAGQKEFSSVGRLTAPQNRAKPQMEKPAAASSSPKGKVVSASSFEAGEGDAEHAVDGDTDTFWHSHWSGEPANPPHFLTIDYAQPLNIAAVRYVARGDDNDNGLVKDYEIYLSNDGQSWGGPAAKGRIDRDAAEELIQLPQPVMARYLKFVVLSEQHGRKFATVAELQVVEAKKE